MKGKFEAILKRSNEKSKIMFQVFDVLFFVVLGVKRAEDF